MSIEQCPEVNSSSSSELNRHFANLCLSSENVSPNIIKATEIINPNSNESTAELLLMSMPTLTKNNTAEWGSENESEASSSVGLNCRNVRYKPVRFDNGQTERPLTIDRAIRTSSAASVTVKRAISLPRSSVQPSKYIAPPPLKQANRNKLLLAEQSSSPLSLNHNRSVQTRTAKPQKPNSLPHVQSRSCKPASTPNSSAKRLGTPVNISMDGTAAVRIRSSLLSIELKSITNTSSNPYGTVPRRRKQKSVEDLLNARSSESVRSTSVSCDARMTSSMNMGARKQLQLNSSGMSSNSSSAWTTPTQTHANRWPKHTNASNTNSLNRTHSQSRKPQQLAILKAQRTRIYYEQSVQTTLTSDDMMKLFAGGYSDPGPLARNAASYDCFDQETQCTDIRDNEIEKLRDEVRSLTAKLQREREEKLLLQSELQLNTERVMSMLEIARINGIGGSGDGWTPTSEDDASTGTGSCSVSGHDSLLMLESQIQLSGHELVERQQEVRQLRHLCRSLQSEMQRSIAAQQFLLQEKAAIEQESNELQDFLQHEKTAMYDALRELETDYEACKIQLAHRDDDVKALREKCQYLVRLNEQRRQENLLLQTKYSAFKSKSQNFVAHQHSSISMAYAVLSKLHGRLRNLVDELKLTYNLSEQDLEKQSIPYDNQAEIANDTMSTESLDFEHENGNNNASTQYFQKNNPYKTVLELSSENYGIGGDESALSPQRHQTFIAAIISAIRSATTPSKRPQTQINDTNFDQLTSNGNSTDQNDGTSEMLDSETEPCLMMDNVLEDVKLPDTYSQNMVTKSSSFPPDIELLNVINTEIVPGENLSLHNLSQAIVNRQNIEMQTSENSVEILSQSLFGEFQDAKSLIEKVNDLDMLVTRLLRLIQMDNDNCIQQLIVDKNKLQQHREEMLEKIRELQEVNIKLQDDLMDATQELMMKNNELSTKSDLPSHANGIDVRF